MKKGLSWSFSSRMENVITLAITSNSLTTTNIKKMLQC